jgi:hypothetical protein
MAQIKITINVDEDLLVELRHMARGIRNTISVFNEQGFKRRLEIEATLFFENLYVRAKLCRRGLRINRRLGLVFDTFWLF